MRRDFRSENEHLQLGCQYVELCTCRHTFYLFTLKPEFWPLVFAIFLDASFKILKSV